MSYTDELGTTYFPEHAQTDAHGTEYLPYIDSNGCIGYACSKEGRETEFLYFNPSSDDDGDPPQSNVFVYHGDTGNPANDMPCNFYAVQEQE